MVVLEKEEFHPCCAVFVEEMVRCAACFMEASWDKSACYFSMVVVDAATIHDTTSAYSELSMKLLVIEIS